MFQTLSTMLISIFETMRGQYDDMPTLSVLDFCNCGHIVIMATCGQIDGANHRYSSTTISSERNIVTRVYRCHPSSRISLHILQLERFECLWPIMWYVMQNFVILTRIFVMHCSPGANQSVYRAYVCIQWYRRCLC